MLKKLAFKNAGKSVRDYAIYFFTLTFGVCIFYMFNSIYAQQAMLDMTAEKKQAVEVIQEMLGYLSVFVAIVLGFLIIYANNFFIKRRKKELGIYMTLGMNKRSISMILILETSLMALLALVLGLVIGVFLSQFMSLFTANLFEADLKKFRFVFSAGAALKSLLYFGIIFLIVILFNTFTISRFKLIDLIYGGRKNEKLGIRNAKVSAILCVLSMILLGIAYYLIIQNGMFVIDRVFMSSILLGILGTVLFFYSLSGLLLYFVRSRKKIYYKELNMFVVRQLGSKVNTNFISISVVCLVLLLTIGIFSLGYSMQNYLSADLRSMANYDLSIYAFGSNANDPDVSFRAPYELIEQHPELITGHTQITLYYSSNTYGDLGVDLGKDYESGLDNSLSYVCLSDYNALLELCGKDPIVLQPDECALLTSNDYFKDLAARLMDASLTVPVNDAELHPVCTTSTSLSNMQYDMVIIVNDNYVISEQSGVSILNIMTPDRDATTDFCTLLNAFPNKSSDQEISSGFSYYTSREEIAASSVSISALFAFFSIYLGLVFMITCAAILAIQQLSEAADNKDRYELLSKLGADKKMQHKALFVQILIYFLLPLLLAVVHSVFGLYAANETLITIVKIDIVKSSVMTALFVGFLYVAYFLMTYFGSRRIISKR